MPKPDGSEPEATRPSMPPAYGLASATSVPGERLSWQRAREWMEAARLYWVATVRPDGRPHVMPVEGIWLDGKFYFGAGPGTRRERNLAENSAVVVHSESAERAVIIEGIAERELDVEILKRLSDVNEKKYGLRPTLDQQLGATYALRPRTAFGFVESDFIESATRWKFSRL